MLPDNLSNIQIKNGPFKALGVWFTNDEEESIKLNFSERIKNMKTLTNIWNCRQLSLKGKIMILKTLVLPQIQFLLGMIYVPDKILLEIDTILFNFLWTGKPSKIKKSTIIAPLAEGGLGMIDIHAVHTAAKCSWLKRLFYQSDSKWKKSMWYMLNIDTKVLNKNYNNHICKRAKSNFHQQILQLSLELHETIPTNKTDILNEYIIYNKNILLNKKM